jgi:hypothetical protein
MAANVGRIGRTANGDIEELSVQVGDRWCADDLTAIAGALSAVGNPDGFETDLADRGPVTQVDHRTASGHIEELSVS